MTFEEMEIELQKLKGKERYATMHELNPEYAKKGKIDDVLQLLQDAPPVETSPPYNRTEHFKQVEINALMSKPMTELLNGDGLEKLAKLCPASYKKRIADWKEFNKK